MKKIISILVAVVIILSVSTISVSAWAATPTAGKISISRKINLKQFHFIHIMRVVERKEATCKSNGYIKYKCYKCNRTTKTILKAKPHKIVVDSAVPATCTDSGLTKGSHCSVCGKIIKKQNILTPLGHKTVVDKEVPATCTDSGLTRGSHCSVCGTVIEEQKSVAPLGHEIVIDEAIERTCFTDGLSEGTHCSRCGEILKAQNVLKARGQHGLCYYNVITPATIDNDGEYQKVCVDCDEVVRTCVIKKPVRIALYEKSGNKETYKTKYSYTGRAIEPSVKVYDSDGSQLFDDNYKVTYSNNVYPSIATVTIDFNDVDNESVFYEGVMEATFEIYIEEQPELPTETEKTTKLSTPAIIKAQCGDVINSIGIYHTISPGCNTYDVEYSLNSSFKESTVKRVVTVNNGMFGAATVKVDVSSGTPRTEKTYYVRIRAADVERERVTSWSTSRSVSIYTDGLIW